jgi:hypothetical protein
MNEELPQLSYDEVVRAHSLAQQRHPMFAKMSLQEFAQLGDKALGGNVFSAGNVGRVGQAVRKVSGSFDTLLEPVGEMTGDAMGSLGELISPKVGQVSQQVGKGLPRAIADMSLAFSGVPPLQALGLASAGSKGYSDTGSPLVGAISAAGLAALPKMAGAGIQAATRISKPLGAAIEPIAGGGLAGLFERGVEYAGAQGAGLVNQELTRQGSNAAMGQFKEKFNPFTEENILPTAIGSLAFGVVDAPLLARGYRAGSSGPEPFSLLNAFSPERPLTRSLADFQRQSSAQTELKAAVKNYDNTLKMDPPTVDDFDVDAAVDSIIAEGNPNNYKKAEDVAQTIDRIPDPQIQEALKRFKATLDAVPETQAAISTGQPEVVKGVTTPAKPKAKEKKGVKKKDELAESLAEENDPNTPSEQEQVEIQDELQAELASLSKEELRPVMQKVDEVTNGNMEQVARSVEAIVAEPMPKEMVGSKKLDVDLAKAHALKHAESLGMNPTGQDVLLSSTEQFFTKLFSLRGYSPTENVRLTNIAVRMAGMAGQQAAGTKVVNNPNPGENFFGPGKPGMVQSIVSLSKLNAGMSKEIENALSFFTFGHEMTHVATNTPENLGDKLSTLVAEMKVAVKNNNPEDNIATTSALFKSIFPESVLGKEAVEGILESRNSIYKTGNVDEVISDWSGLLMMGLASPSPIAVKNMQEALFFGPDRIRDFSNALYTDMSGVLDAVAEFSGGKADTKKALENLKAMLTSNIAADNMVRSIQDIVTRAAPRVFEKDLPTITRDTYRALITKDDSIKDMSLKDTYNMFKGAGELLTKQGWETKNSLYKFAQNFVPMAQRAKSMPEIRPIVDLGFSFAAIATKMSEKMFQPFLKENGKLDEEFLVKMMDPNGKYNKPLNEIVLKMNEAERWYNDGELAEATKGMSKEDVEFVKIALDRISKANQMAATERVRGYEAQIKNMMSTIVMQKAHLFPEKVNEGLADAISESIYANIISRETPTMDTGIVPPEVLKRLVNYAESMRQPLVNFSESMLGKDGKGKQWWTSEVRLGNHYLSWKDDKGAPVVVAYDSQFDANKRKAAEESKGRKVAQWNKHDRFEAFKDLSPDLVQRYAAADKVLFERALAQLDLDENIRKDMEALYQPGAGASEMITPPSLQVRELVGGREELNMMAGVVHYLNSTAMGLAKRYVKGRVPIALHTPELRLESNRGLQNEMRTYIQDIINMPGKELHTLKNLVFFNYLAGNLSAMLVEPTQQFIAHVPYLVREGAKVGEAYKHVLGSLKEATAYAWSSKGPGKIEDPRKHENILRAIDEQVINKGFLQDVSQFEDVNVVNLHNLATGGPLVKGSNLLKNKLYWVFAAMRNMYAASTQLNSAAAFISAYDFHLNRLKKAGGSSLDAAHEEAYSFARTAVRTTMYGGGRAARPLGIAKFGQAQGIASLAYSLQSYTFSTMSMMARLGREMISKVPSSEQASARKAFGLMMGTQFLLGGALGLPMTSAIVGLVDQFYPEAELRKKIREGSSFLASLVTDDEELGQVLSTGTLNGIANSISPIDFGSRFQLGNAFGVNSFDGFSFQNLLGPAANMMKNYTTGASAALSGDMWELKRNIAPTSIRGLLELHHNDWKERDRQGKLLFEPTATELAARLVGFRPQRLNNHYEQLRILRQSEEVVNKKIQRFHEELVEKLQQGQTSEVRQSLLDKARATPGYDPRAGARRVVEILQERTTPVDVSRQGRRITADDHARTLGSFPSSTVPRPSEVQLLQQRKMTERQLGIPGVGRIGSSEISHAGMVDRVLQMNPTMTTLQAKAVVEQMLNPKRGLGQL